MLAEITRVLNRLELAAGQAKVRPVVFFDEIQELLLSPRERDSKATLWAIRNAIQHHVHVRYVLAGSVQRLFEQLSRGTTAPFLNLGTELVVPPVTAAEADAWAIPLFRRGGRPVRTLEAAAEVLCGKIGELVEVLSVLWSAASRRIFWTKARSGWRFLLTPDARRMSGQSCAD